MSGEKFLIPEDKKKDKVKTQHQIIYLLFLPD